MYEERWRIRYALTCRIILDPSAVILGEEQLRATTTNVVDEMWIIHSVCTNSPTAHIAYVTGDLHMLAKLDEQLGTRYITSRNRRRQPQVIVPDFICPTLYLYDRGHNGSKQ